MWRFFLNFYIVVFPCRSTQIKTYSWDNAQVVLAGNKCDMEEERVVSVDSGRLLAEQLGKSWSNIHPFVLFELGAVCHFRALCFYIEAVCKVQQQQQQQLAKLFWKDLICGGCFSLALSLHGHVLLALPRLWILWDQCQGQHQCEADLWTSCRPNLWQDVRELGHWSSRHHRSSHRQTHRQRSAPPTAWMQLLVTDVRKKRGRALQVLQGDSVQGSALPQRYPSY